MENENFINKDSIDEKDYEIYISNQFKPSFDDLHYFDWCEKQANKYCQNAFYYWNLNKQQPNENQQKNLRKQQDFFFDNGNGIGNVDLSVSVPATLNYTNIFKEFYWSVCENMRLFADDVAYYLWLRIYKKRIASKLKAQKFNNISELKNGLDNAFKDNNSWQRFIEELKKSRITFANIYDETHTQELFKSFNELNKSMPENFKQICTNIGKERFLLLLKSIYANFFDFDGKEHDFQNDINLNDETINKKILDARKQVKLCLALYKLFIKDKIEHWNLDNGKIAWLRNNDLLKYAQKPQDGLVYGNDVKMRTGWNNLQDKPLGKLDEKVRNVTWMNYANWDFQDFDGINGRLPGYYDRNGNFIEGEWYWFSEQFDVMINYYDSDVNDLCDWIHTNQDINRKLSMPLVGNKNLGSSCYFNAANVSELGNPINLMFNFKLGHAVLIKQDEKSNLIPKSLYQDDFFVLNDIYKDSYAKFQDNDLKAKYNYNLSYVRYIRLIMDVHLLNIKSKSNTEVAISAKNLRESLKPADKQFDKNEANDSKDLLNFNHELRHTLHTFDNSIIEPMRQDQTNCAVVRNNFLNFRFVNDQSYISSSMYGVDVCSIICKDNHQSYSAQIDNPYNSLDVLISYKQNFIRLRTKGQTPMLTLWELLNNFNQPQKLTGNNQSFCSPCKKLVDATQNSISYNIFEHKSHVTLHINRGKNKINHANVAVPEIVKSGSNYFCLSSIVEHRGSSGEFGHYLCFLNCYADGWNFYDDRNVNYQPNGFGDVFQDTYTLNNSKIGHVYQYTKIGPTEYLYLKNNETIAIPSKNGKNNKFIRGAEAHCLRRVIKYFCQIHNDGNDINIYESNENKIKSELEKIVVYKYPDSKNKNQFVSVTLWNYFQDMNLNLIFPYIFQLYKRNWDTWNYYEVNHEKVEPEYLSSSYEYNLCFQLIEGWNNRYHTFNPVQQIVYNAINKKIPSLQINKFPPNNFQASAFDQTNQTNNVKINSNLNEIEQNKNSISNEIKNENTIKSDINNNFKVSNQDNVNQIINIGEVKDKNKTENKIVAESKIQNEINKIENNSSEVIDISNKNQLQNFSKNANENNENEIVTDNKISIKEIQDEEDSINKIDANKNNENNLFTVEKLDNSQQENQNDNEGMPKESNKNENKEDESKTTFKKNDKTDKKNENEIAITNEMEQINSEEKNSIEKQFQDENDKRNENKINKSHSTSGKNKKIAKTLIIIGLILILAALVVLLCKIYLAAIIVSSIGSIIAGVGLIWMMILNCIKGNLDPNNLHVPLCNQETTLKTQEQNIVKEQSLGDNYITKKDVL